MFALQDATGAWVMSVRTSTRLTWSSRHLARMAAQHLAKQYGRLEVTAA